MAGPASASPHLTPAELRLLDYLPDTLHPNPEDQTFDKALTEAIEESLAAVLNGGAEDDLFNRLIVTAGLFSALLRFSILERRALG